MSDINESVFVEQIMEAAKAAEQILARDTGITDMIRGCAPGSAHSSTECETPNEG